MSKIMVLNDKQRDKLEKMLDIFGNGGTHYTPHNQKLIENLLKHGIFDDKLENDYSLNDDCVYAVMAVTAADGPVYTRHIVGDADEDRVQHCLVCGEIVSDYSGAMAWTGDGGPPTGFAPGEIFTFTTGGSTTLSTSLPLWYDRIDCIQK